MLVALSAIEFDPDGHVWLRVQPKSVLDAERARRVNRVATLDGGAVFNDWGFSDSDRTIELVWTVTDKATQAAVERLLRLYGRLYLALPDGMFEVAPQAYTPGVSESRLRLLVARRLSA